MEDLNSATKAPPAPSMVPASMKKPKTTSPVTPVSSTLVSLREALGVDAHLLNHLPIASITMVQSKEPTYGTQCLPSKIFVGKIQNDSKKEDACALLSADIRTQDGWCPAFADLFRWARQGND